MDDTNSKKNRSYMDIFKPQTQIIYKNKQLQDGN